MCGLAGVMRFDGARPAMEVIERMGNLLFHRGPDDAGHFIESNIGLTFKRLSIIDLQYGHQPMHKKNSVIVFNGELYNYKLLRKELEARGHVFSTNSDTEVVLAAYIEWHHEAMSRFNGIFAFAVWNRDTKSLFLARDKFGVKPLYIASDDTRLLFASEIKSILAVGFPAEINKDDVPEFFHFGCVTGERTMFKNICSVLPGTWREYHASGSSTVVRYWDINADKPISGNTQEEWESRVVSSLESAVASQLVSDVPVGMLLSGGVDSNVLARLMRNAIGDVDFHTYNVKMEEPELDESVFAQASADLVNSMHHFTVVSKQRYMDNLLYYAWLNDEPVMFSNSIYLHLLCRMAKKDGINVLLSGEGADELFGGYSRFMYTLRRLSQNDKSFSRSELMILGSAFVDYDEVKALLGRTDWDNPWRQSSYDRFRHLSDADCLMRMDQRTRLVPLLNRQDRVGMGTGVEIRVPFLDDKVVGLANSIPSEYRVDQSKSKIILKDIAVKMGFSKEATFRAKMGLPPPVTEWIKRKDFSAFLDFVGRGDSSAAELYDIDYAKKIIESNHKGLYDYSRVIWQLVALEIWSRMFIDKTLQYDYGEKSPGCVAMLAS